MQSLRNAHAIARFVLVWFALAMGVAIASPLVKPQSVQLVCSAAGVAKVVADGGGDDTSGSLPSTLDCPLCAAVGAPPLVTVPLAGPMGLSYALPAPVAVHPHQNPAAPFPPRGPPAAA